LNVPVARTRSRILLLEGVTGVGCCDAVAFEDGSAASVAAETLAASGIVLLGGVTGERCVGCRTAMVGFGASFFAVRAGAFFSFSFTAALFVLALLAPVVFSDVAIVPASSVVTFLGRPRFLTAGGSIVLGVDIARGQLNACSVRIVYLQS
jgi:hypothetical protein